MPDAVLQAELIDLIASLGSFGFSVAAFWLLLELRRKAHEGRRRETDQARGKRAA